MATGSVLIIEHDKDLRDLLTYIFKKEGYTVFATKKSKEGYKIAKKVHPAFVMLGYNKKWEKLESFCRKVRKKKKLQKLPIILLTTNPHFKEEPKYQKLDVDQIIVTPIKPKKLIASVKEFTSMLEQA
ncbi:MAG: response regulator [Bacteroidota bacterium]